MENKCERCKNKPNGLTSGMIITKCQTCTRDEYYRTDNFEPAEPVVLSAEELFWNGIKKFSSVTGWHQDEVRELITDGIRNGRLSRDLELRGLVEAAMEFLKDMNQDSTDSITLSLHRVKINAILQNLKPLNKEAV